MASASSNVRFLRVRSSSLIRPIWTGAYFWMSIMSDPTDSSCCMKLRLRPWMTETMPMTVITPMMMPRMVRKERSL